MKIRGQIFFLFESTCNKMHHDLGQDFGLWKWVFGVYKFF